MQAPFGSVAVHVADGLVQRLHLSAEPAPEAGEPDPLSLRVRDEIARYLDDARHRPDLPLAPAASAFAGRVRAALMSIPVGETRSYGDLAEALDSAARAVGGACRSNPLPIVVPCHRVVARGGRGGFMGHVDGPALDVKNWLLRHEQECAPAAGRLL